MNRAAGVAIVVLGSLVLAGCSSGVTDEMRSRCYETLSLPTRLDKTLTAEETAAGFLEAQETCGELEATDPAAFAESWASPSE